MDNNRVPSGSPDLTQDNIGKMKELFPEIVTEGKVDFDMLKTVLGEGIDDRNERYKFEWHGKKESLLGSQQPSKGTLRPDKEASKNFDTTENLYIEGDNLEVLKLLQKSYNGKVKMIYIDPPYNTGNDFVYEDDFKDNIQNYLEQTGQVDGEGNKMSTNTETSGRKHTNWLNMMYPRLKLARNLLTNDGVMFISIDENEVTNLYKVCKEILGEKNIIGPLPVVMNLKGNQDAYGFAETHEFVIVCFKNKDLTTLGYLPIEDEELSAEWKEDSYGFFKEADNLRATGVNAPREKRPNLWYPIFLNEATKLFYVSDINKPIDENDTVIYPVNPEGEELSWYWSKATFNNNKHNLILKHTSNGWQFYRKQRPKLGDLPTKKPKSFLFKPEYSTSTATTKLKDLMTRKIFDGPKPVPFLIDLMRLATNKESVILDFFSGSATTAHAAMKLNAEGGGSRKFIMVQLPEETDDKSEAYKAGYKTISEIGQERIRRAGENIIEESSEAAEHLDIGFKVLKLDKSNIREWNVDFEDLEGQITSYDNMFVPGRSEIDVVYEIMLKYGLELTYPINSFRVEDKNIYDIAFGNLFVCLDEKIDTTIAQAIIDKRNEYGIETSSVVFADHGFHGNDSEKLNCFKLLEDAGYQNEQLMTI